MKKIFLLFGLVLPVLFCPGCRGSAGDPGEPEENERVSREEAAEAEPSLTDYPRLMTETRRTAREMEVLLPLRQALEMFHALEGRYPEELEELVSEGYYDRLPAPPEGTRFRYRPENGSLELVPEENG